MDKQQLNAWKSWFCFKNPSRQKYSLTRSLKLFLVRPKIKLSSSTKKCSNTSLSKQKSNSHLLVLEQSFFFGHRLQSGGEVAALAKCWKNGNMTLGFQKRGISEVKDGCSMVFPGRFWLGFVPLWMQNVAKKELGFSNPCKTTAVFVEIWFLFSIVFFWMFFLDKLVSFTTALRHLINQKKVKFKSTETPKKPAPPAAAAVAAVGQMFKQISRS